MIYKNIEIHNVAELIYNEDGSISWKRVPSDVHAQMEAGGANGAVLGCTGVELRFVMKSDTVTIKMCKGDSAKDSTNNFHVYRGGVQGGWQDHEVHKCVGNEIEDFVIEKSKNIENLKIISEKIGSSWDPEVVRVIFDRGSYKIYDIIGDVQPPKPQMKPSKTLLCYGSSITHGSNSIDASHSWVSMVGHNLDLDVRNLGMAGSCALEPAMAEYIASEGEKGAWDIATLELGINVIGWEESKIKDRVHNIINQVASRNPKKPIFIISPFYYGGETFKSSQGGTKWRNILEKSIKELGYPNVTYICGLDAIDSVAYMTADEIHPSIYGAQRIARLVTERIKNAIKK